MYTKKLSLKRIPPPAETIPHQYQTHKSICNCCGHLLTYPSLFYRKLDAKEGVISAFDCQTTREVTETIKAIMKYDLPITYPDDLPPLSPSTHCEYCTAKYCSKTCYEQDIQNGHHIHCKKNHSIKLSYDVEMMVKSILNSDYYFPGNILLIYKMLCMLESYYTNTPTQNKYTILDYLDHLSYRKNHATKIDIKYHLTYFRTIFSKYVTFSLTPSSFSYWLSEAGFARLFSIVASNSFSIPIYCPTFLLSPPNTTPNSKLTSTGNELLVDYTHDDFQYSGLFNLGSYLNHACYGVHNVAAQHPTDVDSPSPSSFRFVFKAARPIKKGEELFWCYTEDLSLLKHNYAFQCTCNICMGKQKRITMAQEQIDYADQQLELLNKQLDEAEQMEQNQQNQPTEPIEQVLKKKKENKKATDLNFINKKRFKKLKSPSNNIEQ
jgi:hypothetical protein